MNGQKGVSYHAFGIDRHDRVGANQAVKPLVHSHLYDKAAIRRIGHVYLGHLARIHAGNLYLGTLGNTIEIGELGIKRHGARECLVTTSDEKDTESEQRYPGDDENPYSKISFRHNFTP